MRKDKCPRCGGELEVPHPPKFSPEDKYGKYRLVMKIISGVLRVKPETAKLVLERTGLLQALQGVYSQSDK